MTLTNVDGARTVFVNMVRWYMAKPRTDADMLLQWMATYQHPYVCVDDAIREEALPGADRLRYESAFQALADAERVHTRTLAEGL